MDRSQYAVTILPNSSDKVESCLFPRTTALTEIESKWKSVDSRPVEWLRVPFAGQIHNIITNGKLKINSRHSKSANRRPSNNSNYKAGREAELVNAQTKSKRIEKRKEKKKFLTSKTRISRRERENRYFSESDSSEHIAVFVCDRMCVCVRTESQSKQTNECDSLWANLMA